jgi:hypothetical protein
MKFILAIILIALLRVTSSQKIIACKALQDTCTFREQIVQGNEEVLLRSQHNGTSDDDIKIVEFLASSIHSLPPQLFSKFSNLKVIYTNRDLIREIKEGTFELATNLEFLNLGFNSLFYLKDGVFQGAEVLNFLRLTQCNIKQIEVDAFRGLAKLERLFMDFNKITDIPKDTFKELVDLQEIQLNSNQIQFLHQELFKYNPKLKKINLSDNELIFVHHQMFSHLSQLNELFLYNNVCVNKRFIDEPFDQIERSLTICRNHYGIWELSEKSKIVDERLEKLEQQNAENSLVLQEMSKTIQKILETLGQ